jgi:type I restriction enzyme M protein
MLEVHIPGMAQPKLNQLALNKIDIPFPPLEIQEKIVAEIEGYQKVIDDCRELIVKYEDKIKKVVDGIGEE